MHDEWTVRLPEELRIPYFLAREIVYHVVAAGLPFSHDAMVIDGVVYEPDKEGLAEDILRLRECVDELQSVLSGESWRFNAVNDKPLTFEIPCWAVPLVETNAHSLVAGIGGCVSWEFIRTVKMLEYPGSWTQDHPITAKMVTDNFDRLSECHMNLGGVATYEALYGMLDQEIAKLYASYGSNIPPQQSDETHGEPAIERAESKTEVKSEPRVVPRLSNSEIAIIKVLKHSGKRLTTKELLSALENDCGAASEGTTKVTLAGLVRRGLLTNRQDVSPKGYGLHE